MLYFQKYITSWAEGVLVLDPMQTSSSNFGT